MYLNKKVIFLFMIFALFFFTGCSEKKQNNNQETKEQKTKVDIHTIKKQSYPIWVNFSGKTQAFKNVSITSRVSGELQETFFKAGQEVTKEQLLFKIDDTRYKNIVEQKQATLQKDKASLNLAIANVNRYAPLVKKGLASKEKLDQLLAEQKKLKAIVNADIAALNQAKLDVEYTKIKATINGVIGKSLVDIGNMISASSTNLAKVVQADPLYANFSPSTNEVALIKKYKSQEKPEVEVIQAANEQNSVKTTGYVDFIDNVTDQATGTVAIRAVIDNKKGLLLPGTFVQINLFITDQIDVIAVNPNNLGQNQLGAYVLVVDEENKIQTKQVTLSYSNSDLVIISKGLNEGDKLIVSDIAKLSNGLSVEATEVANPIKL